MPSSRKDGRGHRPKGRRHNPDAGDWGLVLLDLQRLLDEHGEPGRISTRVVAKAVGVRDGKTVWKWLRHINRPDEDTQWKVRVWVRGMKAIIQRREGREK